ncbi:MAG: c-type cytochrome [Myxococcota bacterium]
MVWAKRIGIVLGALAVLLVLFVGWVWFKTNSLLNTKWDVPTVRYEHPWPFDDHDLAEIRAELAAKLPAPEPVADGQEAPPPVDPLAGVDLDALRTTRAIARGEKLAIRLGCLECHGADLGGNVVMDVPPVMGLIAPNLTLGEGGLPGEFSLDDFDRMVRHGVKRDGTTALMPAIDYEYLSNKELSDLYAYVLSKPHVNRTMPPPYWGPVMRVLIATGQVPPPAAFHIDHDRKPRQTPPTKAITVEYGDHLARTCRGCHRATYVGGPIAEGDPDWPPAANLTPHEEGLKGWTKEDFFAVMRSGRRPDGTFVDPKGMPWQSVGRMDDVETEAVWVYLQSLEPAPTGR